MKIQSLDLWSNLYLTESKYNLLVKPVNLARALWPIFLLVVIFVLVFSAHWPIEVFGIEALFIISYSVWYWLSERRLVKAQTASLVLQPSGEVSLDGCSGYQLHANSRVGWLGCWLIYQAKPEAIQNFGQALKQGKQNKNTAQTIHQFYARQQFSEQDYARLSRFILRNRSKN